MAGWCRSDRAVRLGLVLLLALVTVLGGVPPVEAASFTVNSTLDEIDANPGDGACSSTPSGVCTLRAAIVEANFQGGAHAITVPAGTFVLSIPGGEDFSQAGDLDIRANITIFGAGMTSTIVDANHIDRVFHVVQGGQARLLDLTIRNGTAYNGQGGGIWAPLSTPILTRVQVSGNDLFGIATGKGGGVLSASLTLEQSTVSGNTGQDGAGVYTGDLTVTGSTIASNTAVGEGGGIRATGRLTMTNSVVRDNSAQDGGGIWLRFSIGSTITSSSIRTNQATTGTGGGVNADRLTIFESEIVNNTAAGAGGIAGEPANTPITITRSRIVGNHGNSQGGGISGGLLTLSETTVADNTAQDGGGIYHTEVLRMSRSTVSGNTATNGVGGGILGLYRQYIDNSTISGNAATGNGTTTGLGGGIAYGDNTGASVTPSNLTNVTIGNNNAPRGSGFYSSGAPYTFKNTIVAQNVASADCFRVGPTTSLGHNLDGTNGCGFNAAGDLQNTDPLLGPLADNGSLTMTHALLPGSPAIDAGDNTGCPAIDQRGVQRPRDGDGNGTFVCDIGAFEAPGSLQAPTPTLTFTPTVTPTPTATTIPALCQPRPPVRVATTQTGSGTLTVTVTLGASDGTPTNAFQRIGFTGGSNATVEAGGQPPRPPGFEYTPEGGQTTTFTVRRVAPGPFTVQFTVTDACGPWQSFAGGGANVP